MERFSHILCLLFKDSLITLVIFKPPGVRLDSNKEHLILMKALKKILNDIINYYKSRRNETKIIISDN